MTQPFLRDTSEAPIQVLGRTRRQVLRCPRPPLLRNVGTVESICFAHATGIRESAAQRKYTYAFLDTLSGPDAGLQVLLRVG